MDKKNQKIYRDSKANNEKREIVRSAFSNLFLEAKKLTAEPNSVLAAYRDVAASPNKLPLLDAFRTVKWDSLLRSDVFNRLFQEPPQAHFQPS